MEVIITSSSFYSTYLCITYCILKIFKSNGFFMVTGDFEPGRAPPLKSGVLGRCPTIIVALCYIQCPIHTDIQIQYNTTLYIHESADQATKT